MGSLREIYESKKDLFAESSKMEMERMLRDIDSLEWEVEHGDSHFICDIHGICEVEECDLDSQVGNCYYCGTELKKHSNGHWYHYSAFDADGVLEDESYQTHDHYGAKWPEPRTEEQRELLALRERLGVILGSA